MKTITASFAPIFLWAFHTAESFSTTSTTSSVKTAAGSIPSLEQPKNPSWQESSVAKSTRLFSAVDQEGQQQQQRGPPPQGGPPASISGRPQGGPPTGGGPPGGPPGGGGGPGGPPPQTPAQKLLEQGLDVAFDWLYLGDEIGLQDSSKNLRVLWTRAILNRLEKIDDPIAFELLPKKSRWVANIAANFLPESVLEKLDWIVQRTDFIDGQLKSFLEETDANGKRQVLVLGSGYDTRCLRYGNLPGLGFYCVDLPAVASNCGKIVDRYRNDVAAGDGGSNVAIPKAPTFVPLDLNDVGSPTSLLETLSSAGFVTDGSVPTMVLCEAVLFYLKPEAAQAITGEVFSLPQSRYCLTDNLSKVGVRPGGGPEGPPPIAARSRCETWLTTNQIDLVDHDSIWGGAIHFVGARESQEGNP